MNRYRRMRDALATPIMASDVPASPLGLGAQRLTGTVRPTAYVRTRRVGRGACLCVYARRQVPAEPMPGGARFIGLMVLAVGLLAQPADASLTLVEDGEARVPIVVFENAPPKTARAARELAEYIEKTSGARLEVIEGQPDPLPDSAIWVGHQPVMDELFPDLDFDFQHSEEILIAANDKHLVIAGRDRWDPEHMIVPRRRGADIVGVQQEYGTVNAVYTFLQDHLGVRWFWPGESGEDVLAQSTIAFEPFTYRYHPQFRARAGIFAIYTLQRQLRGNEWARFQRLQLDSLAFPAGHPFSGWWERFHETNPEYFAMQPDGTRAEWPRGRTAKLCKSSPAVWAQWLEDVEAGLERNPNRITFGANANDGWTYGYCICDQCIAWDHAEGPMFRISWQGLSQEYVAMTDRQITFANTLARMLRERFPERDDLLVSAMAYGVSRTPPVEARPDDNVLVSGVWSFHNQPGDEHRQWFVEWSKVAPILAWRPNMSSRAGWHAGFPNAAPRRVMEDLRFVAEHNVIGVFIDQVYGGWAGQGPHYYLLAQMAWNPYADGEAILADYYQRAFGPAAETMTGYWEAVTRAAERIVFEGDSDRDVWDAAFFEEVFARLDQAAAETAVDGAEPFAQRVGFVRVGMEYLRLMREMDPLIDKMAETRGHDPDARAAAEAKWDAAWEEIAPMRREHPLAIAPFYVNPRWHRLQRFSPARFD